MCRNPPVGGMGASLKPANTADTADTAAPAVTASSHQKAPATTSSPTEESDENVRWKYWGRLPTAAAVTAPEPRKVLHPIKPTPPKTPPHAHHYWLATRTDPPLGGVWSSPVESFGESESDTDDVPDRGSTTMLDRSEVAEEIRRRYTPEQLYGCKFEQSVQTVRRRYSERPCGPLS
mgnify:CR=1 FL=1